MLEQGPKHFIPGSPDALFASEKINKLKSSCAVFELS